MILLTPSKILLFAAFFIASIVDAVCGGGGLITVPALIFAGIPMRCVMGTNQTAMTLGVVAAFLKFRKSGYVNYKAALPAALTAIAGAALGARMNLLIPEQILKMILVMLIPMIGFIVLFRRDFGAENHIDEIPEERILPISVAIGFFIGAYQGFYGAGSGVFFLLAFVQFLKLDLVNASGATKLVLVAAVLTGAFTYMMSGAVIWSTAIPAAVFCTAGSYVGAKLAVTGGKRIIRPMFGGILVLLVIKLAAELVS